jgi:hypothetical protein
MFDGQRPAPERLAEEEVIRFVSAMCYPPMKDSEMVIRLAGEEGDVIDLVTILSAPGGWRSQCSILSTRWLV